MIITWHGIGAIKMTEGEVELDINPHSEKSPKMPKVSPDVLLLGKKNMATDMVKTTPFIVDRPGEFESKGVFVYGVEGNADESEKITTFVVEMGGIIVGYLGYMIQDELTPKQLEKFEGSDILILPVGGADGLNVKQAIKIINQVEPRIIIPIQYKVEGSEGEKLDKFLNEYSGARSETAEKLKVVKKDLVAAETKVFVLTLA
jgi:hypothetical protein